MQHFIGASEYNSGTSNSLGVRSTKNQILVSPFTSFVTHEQISQICGIPFSYHKIRILLTLE